MQQQNEAFTPVQPPSKWALKVLFIGDAGVGKTRLMCSVADSVYIDGFRASLGSCFGAKMIDLDSIHVLLQIWNVTDSPRFEQIRQTYYRGGAVAVFVFSITDHSSFNHIKNWIEEVQRVLGNVPAILVGTRPETEKRRRVPMKEARALAKSLGIPYLETREEFAPTLEKALQVLITEILTNN